MADNKKSFLFYVDWNETFKALPDEKAGLLIKHICSYVNDQNPITDDLLINAVFANIKATLKRDLDKWQLKSDKNRESANVRWNKNNANAYKRIKRNAKHADSDIVIDSVIDSVKEKKDKRFTPPLISEVKEYFKEKGYTEQSAIKAFEYYDVADWKDSKGNKVKSWKQKMQGVWFKDENKSKKVSSNNAHLFTS